METKIIGLDLLRNPQKFGKKKLPMNIDKKIDKKIDTKKEITLEESFKKIMIEKINTFKVPLENYEKSDPFKTQLEACYYMYKYGSN